MYVNMHFFLLKDRNAIPFKQRRWPKAMVHFQIHRSLCKYFRITLLSHAHHEYDHFLYFKTLLKNQSLTCKSTSKVVCIYKRKKFNDILIRSWFSPLSIKVRNFQETNIKINVLSRFSGRNHREKKWSDWERGKEMD